MLKVPFKLHLRKQYFVGRNLISLETHLIFS